MMSREERKQKLEAARAAHHDVYNTVLIATLVGTAGQGALTHSNLVSNAFNIADETILEYAERFPLNKEE